MARVDREELAERAATLVRAWYDASPSDYLDTCEVETIGVALALLWEDGGSEVAHTCSDGRPWAQSGLFRRAMLNADGAMIDEQD